MKLRTHHGGWAVVVSMLAALMLTTLPVPPWAAPWRPAWMALVLIYWCMAVPVRVGVGVGWILGIVLDISTGTLLGQHAFGLSIVAYTTHKLHQRVRVLPLWQQGLSVFGLILTYNMLELWINGVRGNPAGIMAYWTSPLTSMILWPWVFIILRDVRRRYRVY